MRQCLRNELAWSTALNQHLLDGRERSSLAVLFLPLCLVRVDFRKVALVIFFISCNLSDGFVLL